MTQFIAEVGANHNHDLRRALALIDAAADVGCSAVKFQLFKAFNLYARAMDRERVEGDELPEAWLPKLRDRANERHLQFGCSVFDPNGLVTLLACVPNVDFIKISSYSMLDLRLLHAVGAARKPVVLSTGMATVREITEAVVALGGAHVTLLHCVSRYPVLPRDCYLKRISTLRDTFRCHRVGWSDHSALPAVVLAAIFAERADLVECHFDLDGTGKEFMHSWQPEALKTVIYQAQQGLAAIGVDGASGDHSSDPEHQWRADPSDGLRPMQGAR